MSRTSHPRERCHSVNGVSCTWDPPHPLVALRSETKTESNICPIYGAIIFAWHDWSSIRNCPELLRFKGLFCQWYFPDLLARFMWYNNFQNESGMPLYSDCMGDKQISWFTAIHIYVMDEIYYQRKYIWIWFMNKAARLILIYFLAFLPCVSTSPATADGPTDLNFGITYISVSRSTPLAVTGPHGQLASIPLPAFISWFQIIVLCCSLKNWDIKPHTLMSNPPCLSRWVTFYGSELSWNKTNASDPAKHS